MVKTSPIKQLSLLSIITLSITACGGGGSTTSTTPTPDPTPTPTQNVAPTAQITNLPDSALIGLQPYTLSGETSTDSDGSIVSYQWSQIDGQAVTLTATNQSTLSFTPLNLEDTISFELTVKDNRGSTDTHQVTLETQPYFKEFTVTRSESCAIVNDEGNNKLRCWYPTSYSNYYRYLEDFPNPRNLVSGAALSCAETDDGVKCFGSDGYLLHNNLPEFTTTEGLILSGPLACQLTGNDIDCWASTRFSSDTPLNIPELNNPIEVVASDRAICVLDENNDSNKSVKCIVTNDNGNKVPELSNPSKLFGSQDNGICAIDDNGLSCWKPIYYSSGDEGYHWPELGDVTDLAINDSHICFTRESNQAMECRLLKTNEQDSNLALPNLQNPQKLHLANNFGCALDGHGVTCWSPNVNTQLTPPQFDQLTSIDNGLYGSCAIGSIEEEQQLKCWGEPRQSASHLDFRTINFDNPTFVSVNFDGTCVIDANGPRCFGYDYFYSSNSGEIYLPSSWLNASAVEWASDAVCAMIDGSIECFSNWNEYGNANVPPLTNVKEFAAADTFNCVIDDSGIQCWGMQDWNKPEFEIPVPSLTNPKGLSATSTRACAIDQGQVHCWGENDAGSSPPVIISNATKVSAGIDHSCAIDDNGVICWGANNAGQLTVPSLSNPTDVIANQNYSCAKDDTGIVCWGYKGFLDTRITSIEEL